MKGQVQMWARIWEQRLRGNAGVGTDEKAVEGLLEVWRSRGKGRCGSKELQDVGCHRVAASAEGMGRGLENPVSWERCWTKGS